MLQLIARVAGRCLGMNLFSAGNMEKTVVLLVAVFQHGWVGGRSGGCTSSKRYVALAFTFRSRGPTFVLMKTHVTASL